MEVTDEMIERLAHLARLTFAPHEKEELKHDLERMIGFVEKLKEVNTEGVEPLLHITEAENVMRDDEGSPSANQQLPQSRQLGLPHRRRDMLPLHVNH